MDKCSEKVLKYISQHSDSVLNRQVVEEFGEAGRESLSYLEKIHFIKSGRKYLGRGPNSEPVLCSDGKFQITSEGRAYLEEKPGKAYDRWSTRVLAVWGAITGTAAMVLEIVIHFL